MYLYSSIKLPIDRNLLNIGLANILFSCKGGVELIGNVILLFHIVVGSYNIFQK